MRTTLAALCTIFFVFSAYGQDQDTVYLNSSWKKSPRDLASYYRIISPDSSGMWVVEDYFMNGQLQMLGKYSDRRLKKQQG